MLKRTEEYLKNELSNAQSEVLKEKDLLSTRQATFNDHNEILASWKKIRDKKDDIKSQIKAILALILVGGFGSLLLVPYGNGSHWLIMAFAALMDAIIGKNVISDIIENKKNKAAFANIPNAEDQDFSLVGDTNVPVFEYKVQKEKDLVEESIKDVRAYQEYIYTIWDILTSDNYIDKIIKYHEERGYFPDAFTVEWEDFLKEETKPYQPGKFFQGDFKIDAIPEENIKAATEHLHVDIKKLEKSLYNPE